MNTPTLREAAAAALDALEEIALAGMSGTGQETEEGMRAWHARQAWKFIGIAARALDPLRAALASPAAPTAPTFNWPDSAVLSVMNTVSDGPHGEEDIAVTRRFLKRAEEVRAELMETAAPQVQPADEQLDSLRQLPECWTGPGLGASFKHREYARAVLAKFGAAPQVQQAAEPIAYLVRHVGEQVNTGQLVAARSIGSYQRATLERQPLYTAPPPAATRQPLTDALRWLESECCDLRCVDWPTGADDSDIGWTVVQHHQAKPTERVIGTGRTPLEAIEDARKPADDPTRWDYVPAGGIGAEQEPRS